MQSYEYYKSELKKILSPERFEHCVNVSLMAEKLAKTYGVDSEKIKLAGLLHDICKEKSDEENISILKNNGYFGKCLLVNLTHDECNWEFPEELKEFPNIVKSKMEKSAAKYCKSVPIPAEVSVGDYWIH